MQGLVIETHPITDVSSPDFLQMQELEFHDEALKNMLGSPKGEMAR